MTRKRVAIASWMLLWGVLFAYLATIEAVRYDGWWRAAEHAGQPVSLHGLIDFVRFTYNHDNPRLGEWLVWLAFAPGVWHPLLAALGAVGVVVGVFVIAYARAPRDAGDAARLLAIGALLFACLPNPGQLLCYRPYTGNYIWAFAIMLAFGAPYRIALAREAAWGPVAAAGMLVLGLAAGMTNEHTGPVAIAFVIGATVLLRRRGRRVAWAIAGAVGLALGFALLLAAPGQSERYHGLGESSLVGNFVGHGFAGNLRVLGMALLYTSGSWLVLAAAFAKTRRAPWWRELAVIIVLALAIIGTTLVSPKLGFRLYAAPALLLLAAAVRAADEALPARGRRAAVIACALLGLIGSIQLVRLERSAAADADARLVLLRAAPKGSVAAVPPFAHFAPGWWHYGDDFRAAPLRQHVARQLFGLDDITLATEDPAVLGGAGVSLELSPPIEADPGFSDQLFTAAGVAAALERFRTAVGDHHLPRAELVVRGLHWDGVPRVVLAAWDGARFTLPDATTAPAGARILRAGGGITEVRATAPISQALAGLPEGGYFVVTCTTTACQVLATSRRQ